MATKQLYTRVQNKHDLEVNWHHENVTFIPLKGELIIYDVEVDKEGKPLTLPTGRSTPYTYERFKIGDGIHIPKDLPFVDVKNQNAFSNVAVGSTTIAADTTTDTLTLEGSNVTLTPDASNDKLTISITKDNVTTALGYTPPDSDENTTYDLEASKNATNGNVTLNLIAGGSGSGTDSVTIKGSNATTVTSDANGVITIDTAIIDNLETKDSTKPLSANQGAVINALIAALRGDLDKIIPTFIGTMAQYENQKDKIPEHAIVIITDDETGVTPKPDDATSSILGTGVLGYMILG